jgi:hypothetical protein
LQILIGLISGDDFKHAILPQRHGGHGGEKNQVNEDLRECRPKTLCHRAAVGEIYYFGCFYFLVYHKFMSLMLTRQEASSLR